MPFGASMDIFTMVTEAIGLAGIDIKLAIVGVLGLMILIFAFEHIADVFDMAHNKARTAENQKRLDRGHLRNMKKEEPGEEDVDIEDWDTGDDDGENWR